MRSARARGGRLTAYGLLFGCVAIAGWPLLIGCSAYRPPPLPDEGTTPTAPRRLGVARVTYPQDVGKIAKAKVRDFLDRLVEDLRATDLFEAVTTDPNAPAAVVIDPEYGPRSCYSQPLVMYLTLGLFPDSGCYYSGYFLTLRGRALRDGTVTVDNRSEPLILTGLAAGPLLLLPGWESSLPREDEVEALRAALLVALADAGALDGAGAR